MTQTHKLLCCIVAIAIALISQTTPPRDSSQSVNESQGAPQMGFTQRFDYDGANNPIYVGWAASKNKRTDWFINGATLVNIVVAANVGTINFATPHCLEVGYMIHVTGVSADNDLNRNGGGTGALYRVVSVVDTDTITIATLNVSDATYNNNGMNVWTNAPRSCDLIWSIQAWEYDGSNNVLAIKWGNGNPQTYNLNWDNRTAHVYQ